MQKSCIKRTQTKGFLRTWRILVIVSIVFIALIPCRAQHIVKLKGSNPYLTTKVLFGDVTRLISGQQVELLGIEQNKVKVSVNGIVGFVNTEFFEVIDLELAKEIANKEAIRADQRLKNRNDSLAQLHNDSAFFLAKTTKWNDSKQFFSKPNSTQYTFLSPDENVLIRQATDYSYLKVLQLSTGRTGYVLWGNIDLPVKLKDSLNQTLKLQEEIKYKATLKEREASLKERKADLIRRFGSVNAERLLKQKIWLGMSAEMAKVVLGEPEKINRTVTASGKQEQWIYNRKEYYYFTNGTLTAWQD